MASNKVAKPATIREILKENVLEDRKEAAAQTKFDAPAEILRVDGTHISIPRHMRPEKALENIKTWVDSESQTVSVAEYIDGIPIDAANALMLAVKHEFGVVELHGRMSFFGENPPPFFSVPTSAKGENTEVYVGKFTLPGFEGASFQTAPDDANLRLVISGTIRRKDMALFKQLLATARQFLLTDSLYKGKAISINFGSKEEDSDSDTEMLIPKFMDLSEPKPLILARDTEAMLAATVWTPIRHRELVKSMGTPIKRGVLLYGTFGTGKTLTAYETARIAVENGYTFIYVRDVSNLKSTIEFASKQFLPAIIFMEDTEKAFEDPAKINAIQNTMDGIDGKDRDLIVVLTTNYIEQLPAAIMRPGRLDTIIQLKTADPETAARLVAHYAGDRLNVNSDHDRIGIAVQGNIPAAIREVVERSKLFALTRTGSIDFKINHQDIELAAKGMEEHMALLAGGTHTVPSPAELLGHSMGVPISKAVVEGVKYIVNGQMHERDHAAKAGA
jgi:transitional endoplasmic reticulum ATPase